MNCRPILLLGVLSLLLFACQKEVSFEVGKPAKGSLQDQSGECSPKTVSGNYTATLSVGDNNYMDVTVNVAQPGSYTIATDTVNGYYFRGTGSISSTGANSIRLKAYGTPAVAGTDNFTVIFDSTSCSVPVTVLPNTGGSSGTAVYTLDGAPGTCAAILVKGTYTQGSPVTATNTLDVKVNVTTPGTWTLSTAAVNGVAFAGSGTFTTTGAQTISLAATGTPAASGNHTINIQASTTSCSFTLTVAAGTGGGTGGGTGTTSTDYFPTTQGSWWSYDDGAGSDTLKTAVTGTASYIGKTYQRFIDYDNTTPLDSFYCRKDNTAGTYYKYFNIVDMGLSNIITFTQPGLDVLFLKNTLATNDTWNSDNAGTVSGVPTTLRFKYTCENANASITVNGKSFTNVYQVKEELLLGVMGTFSPIATPLTYYYAKGIGLIKATDGTDTQAIRNWNVN